MARRGRPNTYKKDRYIPKEIPRSSVMYIGPGNTCNMGPCTWLFIRSTLPVCVGAHIRKRTSPLVCTRYSTWHSDSLFCKIGVPYGTNLAEAVAAAGRGVVLPEQQEVDGRAEPRVRVRLRVRVGVRGGVRVRARVQVLGSGLGFGA